MSDNKIELKSIRELLGMHFFIPSYQRGYRWTEQQAIDLLNDIWEFAAKKNAEYEFYCIQPLVVKLMDKNSKEKNKLETSEEWYEVIDGQQRLTTIYLILSSLRETIKALKLPTNFYEIKYQRETEDVNVTDYLKNILSIKEIDNSHIDYYHMSRDFLTIQEWINNDEFNAGEFCIALLNHKLDDNPDNPRDKANNVRFIWYESVDEDPIEVFTRLNIGKISLTNAELIKAVFLNRSNFGEENYEHIKLRQNEIASEWDNIEYTLQNDEFWLFLHKKGYDRPTRIDFIFDLICKQKALGDFKNIGNDDYKTFRYFYEYFKGHNNRKEKLELCWKKVKAFFRTFKEWFDDLELYHYVGYLLYNGEKLEELYKKWNNATSKNEFIGSLKDDIKERIKDYKDLSKQYELDGCPSKRACKPLLLLHNIQTTINQNRQLAEKEEYKLPVFYKFPFHLLKHEDWDVEHIDPETENELKDEKDQKEWLKYTYLGLRTKIPEELKEKIKFFLKDEDKKEAFGTLYSEIEKLNPSESWDNPEKEKNKIWNYVLLDSGTNRGYGNSIYAAKRSCIIGKDQGKSYSITDDLEIISKDGEIAFVPPVTKNVFIKYYNTTVTNLLEWTEGDATAYRQNILDTLKEFGVFDSQNKQNGDNNA